MPLMSIESFLNFCYIAFNSTRLVTHYIGLCVNHSQRDISKSRRYPDLSREISYFCTKPSPASGVGVGEGVGDCVGEGVGNGVRHNVGEGLGDGIGDTVSEGVGDGSEREEVIVSVTFTVTAAPTDGVMTTVAVYVPAVKPATSTLKVSAVTCPAASLPVVGETTNHVCEGVPTVHVNVLPPGFWTLTVCVAGLVPAVVVNASEVTLSTI